MGSSTPVVLVHGFWHGTWCWSLVTQELAVRGVPSVAVDLDGHGLKNHSPAARWQRPFDPSAYADEVSAVVAVNASSAAATLVAQLRQIGRGQPCVVVAHSMGGTVATLAAELAPELISELVYLAAFAPSGRPALAYVFSEENAGELVSPNLIGDPAAIGALRLDTGDAGRRAALREAFYQDVDEGTAEAALTLLGTDGPIGIAAEPIMVTADRFGSIPHTYVVCRQDNALRPALQRRLITEIDALSARPTRVIELDSSHSPFFSQPAVLADSIVDVRRTAERHSGHYTEPTSV
ncbi:alpha/beta fold hydrolase [Actinoplanes sp. NPDC051470]|uniref:alpha/beta fold hydrolase n=1 Tax=unclassified Actinoplanes TaxID=2626549 RepID=UPI00341FDF64